LRQAYPSTFTTNICSASSRSRPNLFYLSNTWMR
jgi:hypothetical protein